MLLAALGAFLVVRNGAEVGGSARWFGDVLLLLGGLMWAGYNVLGKYASRGQDAVNLTYHQTVAGAAGFLLASLLEIGEWRMPDASASAMLTYLAVACSVGGFLLYNYGLRRMTSSVAVNILNLVPVDASYRESQLIWSRGRSITGPDLDGWQIAKSRTVIIRDTCCGRLMAPGIGYSNTSRPGQTPTGTSTGTSTSTPPRCVHTSMPPEPRRRRRPHRRPPQKGLQEEQFTCALNCAACWRRRCGRRRTRPFPRRADLQTPPRR
ncbi:DMT family transporter [Streptomyces sp. NBC_01003]|uniref:DMT family transporter n=1 Tax=Streptomyces sp. NBC_01003 TaxID=2903714 RepID=UPI003868FCFC